MHERLLTVDELADTLCSGQSSIYRWIKEMEGFPQPLRLGRAVRFRQSDVDKFIAERAQAKADAA